MNKDLPRALLMDIHDKRAKRSIGELSRAAVRMSSSPLLSDRDEAEDLQGAIAEIVAKEATS